MDTEYLFDREIAYVRQNKKDLKEVFRNEYIAVYRNVVVTSARSKMDALGAVRDQIGTPHPPVLVDTIENILNPPVVEMRSPEIVEESPQPTRDTFPNSWMSE